MIEVNGNLWTYPADYRIITTNGYLKRDGTAVMGRGCAYEAVQRYPGIRQELGSMLRQHGNHVFKFKAYPLLTFPVKHAWYESADRDLITRSVAELLRLIKLRRTYVMPRPGCGNGRLLWSDVRPLLQGLPDNVKVITYG